MSEQEITHRSGCPLKDVRCERCIYFVAGNVSLRVGRCHRYPPTVVYAGESTFKRDLPVMSADEWCGEFDPLPGVMK